MCHDSLLTDAEVADCARTLAYIDFLCLFLTSDLTYLLTYFGPRVFLVFRARSPVRSSPGKLFERVVLAKRATMLAKAQAAAAKAAQQAREAAERAAEKASAIDTDTLMGNAVEGLESRLSGSFAKVSQLAEKSATSPMPSVGSASTPKKRALDNLQREVSTGRHEPRWPISRSHHTRCDGRNSWR